MQRTKQVLLPVTGFMMLATLFLVSFWVPSDQNLGVSHRIFYLHVPIAVLSLVPPFLVFFASIGYLLRNSERWDTFAYSVVEVAVLFTTLTLLTGGIWGQATWGRPWTWDPMLTTFFILWLVYIGYLMIRSYTPPGSAGPRYSAILGIVGSANALIVYYATALWRTTHPEKVLGPLAEQGSLPSEMAIGLLVSTITFVLLFTYVLIERLALRQDESELERLSAWVQGLAQR